MSHKRLKLQSTTPVPPHLVSEVSSSAHIAPLEDGGRGSWVVDCGRSGLGGNCLEDDAVEGWLGRGPCSYRVNRTDDYNDLVIWVEVVREALQSSHGDETGTPSGRLATRVILSVLSLIPH